jgi:hypothetical protein
VNGPTVDPAGREPAEGSSAAATLSAKAPPKRQAAHNPAGETPAVRGAPQRGQGEVDGGVEGAYHLQVGVR